MPSTSVALRPSFTPAPFHPLFPPPLQLDIPGNAPFRACFSLPPLTTSVATPPGTPPLNSPFYCIAGDTSYGARQPFSLCPPGNYCYPPPPFPLPTPPPKPPTPLLCTPGDVPYGACQPSSPGPPGNDPPHPNCHDEVHRQQGVPSPGGPRGAAGGVVCGQLPLCCRHTCCPGRSQICCVRYMYYLYNCASLTLCQLQAFRV